MAQETRTRLLAAAERLIIDEGLNAISIRRIAAETGLNSALTRYYFGSVDGLLLQLAETNLRPMLAAWAEPLAPGADVREVLRRYLAPMWLPACHCPGERALVLIDELVAHGDEALRDSMVAPLLGPFERTIAALAGHLPGLAHDDIAARLSFASAGALGMPPRSRTRTLFPGRTPHGSLEGALRFTLMLFAPD